MVEMVNLVPKETKEREVTQEIKEIWERKGREEYKDHQEEEQYILVGVGPPALKMEHNCYIVEGQLVAIIPIQEVEQITSACQIVQNISKH